ncbi:hypothetical protein BH18ACT4_BH18ACT4_16220 [soil metagenome]
MAEADVVTDAPAAKTGGEAADDHERGHPSDGKYVQIALILAVITAAEVATYYVDMSTTSLVAVLTPMMIVKFAVVAGWFMHLKFDSRVFRRVFVAGLILAVSVYFAALATFHFFA